MTTIISPATDLRPREVTLAAVQGLADQARMTADSLIRMSERIDQLAEAMEISFRPARDDS